MGTQWNGPHFGTMAPAQPCVGMSTLPSWLSVGDDVLIIVGMRMIEYVEPSLGESIELVLGSDIAFYAVITLRFSAGTRFMTRIAVFDSWNCRFFFRMTACSIDCNEASTASKA